MRPIAILHLLRIAAELLSQPHGDGVLQVRAADLDHVVEGRGFAAKFAFEQHRARSTAVRQPFRPPRHAWRRGKRRCSIVPG